MPTDAPAFGWWRPPGARSFHYLPEDYGDRPYALCRRWGFLFGVAPWIFQPDTGPSPDDCKTCRRKLDNRKAASGGG